jgi:hypothetical protein
LNNRYHVENKINYNDDRILERFDTDVNQNMLHAVLRSGLTASDLPLHVVFRGKAHIGQSPAQPRPMGASPFLRPWAERVRR